ncbi:hypothetical protein TrRE_jg10590 [Triparma retinervis]|uniref:Uncharacterized protein n=1 Tax=Triparma retinervis TaxID=2557542 RepID=A0A9W7DSZ1_9STRA|nr:hypothetical protein TrRE_jg10590 [Triparma retinervis]
MKLDSRQYLGGCGALQSSPSGDDAPGSPIPSVSPSFLPLAPLGTMRVKYKRDAVAILPCSGDLSSVLYGVTQRAASLYGSGIEGNKGSPRGVTSNSRGSISLNKVLSSKFTLANAGEDKVRLADLSSGASVGRVLKGFDVVFCGLGMNQRRGKVTGNTYEKGPNDTCLEYYWDGVKGTGYAPPDDGGGKKSLTRPEKMDKIWCRGQQYVMSMIENSSLR